MINMKIRKHQDRIELVAQNTRETRLLAKLFGGEGPNRYRVYSYGYDRKMPKRGGKEGFRWWAKRQVLVFRLDREVST